MPALFILIVRFGKHAPTTVPSLACAAVDARRVQQGCLSCQSTDRQVPRPSTHAFEPCKALVRRWCHSNPILFRLLNAAESRRSRRFLLTRAERLPVRGAPIFTGHKHDESLVAPPYRATDGTYGLALRVELRALAGGRIYQMSGRHMVRAVNGSLAGMANVCFLQCGSANICWRVSRRIYSPLVRRTSANAGLNDSTSPRTLLGQLLASCTPSH